jgi:hypothetical protein
LNLEQAGSGVLRVGSVLLQEVTELLDPEDECSPVLQNMKNYLPVDIL